MAEFTTILLTFPTFLFAACFVLALFYWLMVIVGAADLDLIDGLDGVFEGIDGAVDGLDGAVDAAIDGAAEGLDGAADGAAEAADGVASVAGGFSPLLFLANLLRLGKIPLTISLTFFAISGFVISFFMSWLWLHFPHVVPQALFMVVAFGVSTSGAIGVTNLVCRPFEPMFKLHHARENRSLFGEVCTLKTGRVDAGFGQAEVQVAGDHLLLAVRCDSENTLARGESMLIVSYDKARQAFVVEPLHRGAAASRNAPQLKEGSHS